MRKGALIILGLVGIAGLASLLLLNRYKTDIIHATILNAVIQKAPEDYSQDKIQKRFAAVFQAAQDEGHLDAYLRQLLALGQRLEKIQHLERAEVDEILENLDRDPAEEEKSTSTKSVPGDGLQQSSASPR